LGQRVRNQAALAARRNLLVVDSDQNEDACYSSQQIVERVSIGIVLTSPRMILGLVLKA
jgi:hypothetical protein